jgi:D-alanyl-D-alanine carboxypeptidase/D-alanyl-D-alanine-endopeptidase (penicillin-binding protein 4)
MKSGQVLEQVGGRKGLPPASVAKAMTASYALETLGPEHRFQTQVLMTGALQNGVVTGDLILRGGGDPFLDTDGLAELAARLRAAGVRGVKGRFLVYADDLPYVRSIDPGQPDQLGYSPAVHGIALNFNRVHFEWRRQGSGFSVTMDARTKKYRPTVRSARMQIANRKAPVYGYRDADGIDQWTVARAALGKSGARWLPVRYPATYAGDVFRSMARTRGISLQAARVVRSLPQGARVVTRLDSPPLRFIVGEMLKYSNNLTAEMVGLAATRARGKSPTSLAASAGVMTRWAAARFGMTQTKLVDHSGLGDASRMTAGDLVSAFVQMRSIRPLMKRISIRDANNRVVKGHPVKVDAKTGTLNFVSGLGGYLTAADGSELAFAIFAADTQRRSRLSRAQRARAEGAKGWNSRAKRLQQSLLKRWGAVYGS